MKSQETTRLPAATLEYDKNNEQVARRTSEQAFAILRADVVDVQNTTNKDSSLALRRHQFLLMGG